jgi:hypothetical protein
MALTLDGTNGLTFNDTSLQGAAASPYVLKNRIINGAMVIDQRNAGAILTVNSTAQKYPVDRFYCENSTSGVFTIQQSSTAPAGFNNSVVATVTTGSGSLTGSQYAAIAHQIEGYNVADMNFGTANAKTFTLSFWVQSSVTGTFGGSFRNSADNRCYPFTYTINSANTWEQKSITVAGDTSGTWLTTNGIGLKVWFSFGAGPSWSGTANAWANTLYVSATGATNLLATNGATFYITGVQLEQNTVATPFERRLYDKEFISCQRYFLGLSNTGTYGYYAVGTNASSSSSYVVLPTPVTMRSTPTVTFASIATSIGGAGTAISAVSIFSFGQNNIALQVTGGTYSYGQAVVIQNDSTSAGYMKLSAEL